MALFEPSFKSERSQLDLDPLLGNNSPKYSSSESDCSQDTWMPGILGWLDIDNTELGTPLSTREPVETQEIIGVTTESVTSRKRPSQDAFATETPDNDVGRAKKVAKTDADTQEKTRTQYACPFQKLDPVKHHECLKYALHRIKDVKQHVYRRHKQPDYYCARCFDVFPNADARDKHARSKDCENKKGPGFEGITDVEKNKLNKNPSRGLDAQEQWYRMWDIIFPEEKKPRSVWVGSYIEEMVPVLRSLWARKSSSILTMAQREQPKAVDRSLLDAVVKSIFNSLESEASATLGKHTRGDSSQDQHSPVVGEALMFTEAPTAVNESPCLLYTEPLYFEGIVGEADVKFESGLHGALGEG